MNTLHIASLVLCATITTACFVEVDAPSIELERVCNRTADCTFKGVTTDRVANVPLELMSGSKNVAIDLESGGVIKAHYGDGLIAFDSSLTLDALAIQPLDDMSFDGLQSLGVTREDGVTIAAFQRDVMGTTGDNELILEGNPDVNLLELGTKFTLQLEGAGHLPSQDWMASLVFHVHVNARAH